MLECLKMLMLCSLDSVVESNYVHLLKYCT